MPHTHTHSPQIIAVETVGTRALNGSALVAITIINENDVNPMFENNTYFAIILEDANMGNFVARVSLLHAYYTCKLTASMRF